MKNNLLAVSHVTSLPHQHSLDGEREAGTLPGDPPGVQLFSDSWFNSLFTSSGEALLLVDSSGIVHRANRRARDLLRLKDLNNDSLALGAFLLKPSADRLASFCSRLPGDMSPQSLEASLASGLLVRITLRSILSGSHELLLCIEEGSLVHRADARGRRLEAELRAVLDSVYTGVVLFDPSGRLRFSNARFGQLFGISALELRKIPTFEALDELVAERFRDPASFSAPWNSYAKGTAEPGHDELELNRPAKRVIERFFRPVLDTEGRDVGWIERYSDVTGERQIQSKLLQKEKMAALGQLVSGIAHELNNPLTAIMGYTQLMLGHDLSEAPLSEAKKVYQEAERARRIVKNLLYFARGNAPERTRVDLNELVERTLALRSYELKVENIVVECELTHGLPLTMADPFQLQQVILNLLVNAEQALLEERGKGRIWIRTRHLLEGTGNHTGDRILLEVSDDGPGIPPRIASRIFDPFFTTKAPGVGTGLGLSIVYGIVHQHGGEVTFENQSGAKFVVDLPVVPVPPKEIAPPQSESSTPSRSVTPSRILVVEDEPTVAQLIVDVLREEGHKAEAVLDSQEGLARISRNHYDLVICDLRMPRLDGPAFYRALVSAGSPIRDRIMFITGDTLAPRTLEFLEPNKLPYLTKPFLVEELNLAVNRLLEINRGETADRVPVGGVKPEI